MKFVFFAATLLLSGCGGSKDVSLKNASMAEVAKASQASGQIDPGQWTSTVEVVSISMPGIAGPEGQIAQAMFKNMIGQKQVTDRCITPAEAVKPPEDLLSGKGSNLCRFVTFDLAGGKLKAQMSCMAKAQGGGMTMAMAGNYGSNSFALDTETTIVNPSHMPGGQGMVVKSRTTGKRTGECTAKGTI
jgi:Protein of unknown function (DUF3617)